MGVITGSCRGDGDPTVLVYLLLPTTAHKRSAPLAVVSVETSIKQIQISHQVFNDGAAAAPPVAAPPHYTSELVNLPPLYELILRYFPLRITLIKLLSCRCKHFWPGTSPATRTHESVTSSCPPSEGPDHRRSRRSRRSQRGVGVFKDDPA